LQEKATPLIITPDLYSKPLADKKPLQNGRHSNAIVTPALSPRLAGQMVSVKHQFLGVFSIKSFGVFSRIIQRTELP